MKRNWIGVNKWEFYLAPQLPSKVIVGLKPLTSNWQITFWAIVQLGNNILNRLLCGKSPNSTWGRLLQGGGV